jgi:hypothetical protein
MLDGVGRQCGQFLGGSVEEVFHLRGMSELRGGEG